MGRLARLDTNNDGAIDQQEFATAQNLKDADANGDGTLSKEELVAMIQAPGRASG
jgi:Ca2+-binding EF-hand superfamily protein